MIPVVAIVGRPNVGKSTLFNRLTQSRDALVSDFPGMTRDRQYGKATLYQRRFIVIDTGGMTEEADNINQSIKEQAHQAIQEANHVLFLVDGKTGVTATDLHIVESLRTLNKSIFLVVNKTEGLDPDLALLDFHRLGIGKPHAISAAHNQGIESLIETLFTDIPSEEESSSQDTDSIKLAIVGRPNVGKSTLTNRILGEERVIVSDVAGTTRDSIFIPLERNKRHYTLIDTAGVRRKGRVTEAVEKFSVVKTLQAIDASNVVLFLMDAKEGVTDPDLKLLGFILESGKALVIAMNKWDHLTQDEKDKTRNTLDRKLNFVPFVRQHLISALHGTGVGNLFNSINEAYDSANKKLSTPKLTKILQEALVQHSPPLVKGRRIKLRYAHPGGQNPPLIIIHGTQVNALPDAYVRYLAATYQKRLKLMGTPVRVQFKASENPFRHQKPTVTPRQQRKKTRLMRHVKKKKTNK